MTPPLRHLPPAAARCPVVYIAGPYRAPTPEGVAANIERARLAQEAVWMMGGVPITPHLLSQHMDGRLPDAEFLARDLVLLARCDAVWLIEGWAQSEGARGEEAFAVARGIPCFTAERDLERWVRSVALTGKFRAALDAATGAVREARRMIEQASPAPTHTQEWSA